MEQGQICNVEDETKPEVLTGLKRVGLIRILFKYFAGFTGDAGETIVFKLTVIFSFFVLVSSLLSTVLEQLYLLENVEYMNELSISVSILPHLCCFRL